MNNDYEPALLKDAQLVAVVEAFHDAGETDAMNGGVHHTTVASHLDRDADRIRNRLKDLADRDELERVDGVHPDSGSHRLSYRPVTDL